jgi:FkbM family methyltransferase
MGFRTLVERAARGRKVLRHITVDGRKVELYVSPDSQLKYLKQSGVWDQDLIRLAEQHVQPGDDVWDIGANVGIFAFAAAARSKTGNVYAFEPDTFLVEVIRHSRLRNGLHNVQVLPVAVASEDGFSEFLVAERGRASNALKSSGGRNQMGGVRDSFMVPVFSGSSISASLNSRPSIIKIDVEGAELLVLKGLESVLKGSKPRVYIELGDDTLKEAEAFFAGCGYHTEAINRLDSTLGNYLFAPAD